MKKNEYHCFVQGKAEAEKIRADRREETMKKVTLGLGFAALGFLILTAAMIYHRN